MDTPGPGAAPQGPSFSTGSLQGHYVISYLGSDQVGTTIVGGYLDLDGRGTLAGGGIARADGMVFTGVFFTGSYMVFADGRGTALVDIRQFSSTGVILRTVRLQLTVVSSSLAMITGFDWNSLGNGILQKASTTFAVTDFLGDWVFGLDGTASLPAGVQPFGMVGRFTAALDIHGLPQLSAGVLDTNAGGTVLSQVPFTGTIWVNADGTGLASASFAGGISNFEVFAISTSQVLMVCVDAGADLVGVAERQSATSTSSVSGNYAFYGAGHGPDGAMIWTGLAAANGQGTLTSGMVDENNGGVLTQSASVSGTYGVDASGRGSTSLTLGGHTLTLATYWVSPQKAFFLQTAASVAGHQGVSTGWFQAQLPGTYSTADLAGRLQTQLAGTQWYAPQAASGSLLLDAGGVLVGINQLNRSFSLQWDVAVTGSYAVSAAGRGAFTWTSLEDDETVHQTWYAQSPSLWTVVGADSVDAWGGVARKAQPPVLAASADLTVTVYPPTGIVTAGPLTYGVVVSNNGPATATGVWLVSTMSPKIALAASSAVHATCGGNVFGSFYPVYCRVDDLAPGGQATIQLNVIAVAGTAVSVFSVALNESDPNPGDNTSIVTTTIVNPAPHITLISPAHVTAGSPAFTLGILGSDLISGAVLLWNSSPLPITNPIASNYMETTIPAQNILSPGTVSIAVQNPGPGGGISNSLSLTIDPKPPVTASTAYLDFGLVLQEGWSDWQSVIVTNNQNVPLAITGIEVSPNYWQTSDCGLVAAGGSCTVWLRLHPMTAGGCAGTLTLTHSAPGSPLQVNLWGTATDLWLYLQRPQRSQRLSQQDLVVLGYTALQPAASIMPAAPAVTPADAPKKRHKTRTRKR